MRLSEFGGNPEVKHQLSRSLEEGRLSHSYIIDGPEGIGKTTLSGIVAMGALCTGDPSAGRPCGVCPACLKGEYHPDVKVFRGSDTTGSIGVDAIRQLRADAYIRPNEGERKVYIVEGADKMTVQAQNALLLVFEEPPPYALFLLTAEHYDRLLPTIRSRAERLALTPLSLKECAALLEAKGYPADQAQEAAAGAGGVVGQALALLTEGSAQEARTRAKQFLEILISGKEWQLAAQMKKNAGTKQAFLDFLGALERLLRDVLLIKEHAGQTPYYPGDADLCTRAARTLTNVQLTDIMKQAADMARRLDTNLSQSLGAITFSIRCWEASH